MIRLGSPLRDVRAASAVVAVVALVVYANALGNDFAYDDHHIVANNSAIQSLETLPGALTVPYWPTDYGRELGLWRPVTTALLGLQHVVSGGAPMFFHAVNVVGHAAVSVLVVLLAAALVPLAAALVAGLVFAVHPVHVEAVSNVIGFSEIFSAGALVAAGLLHVRGPPSTGWLRALAIGLLYALGFGAKESAVTLPGLIFLLDAARRQIAFADLGRYLAARWRLYLVMLVVAAGLLAGRYAVLGSIASPFSPLGADLLLEIPKIWTLPEIWIHYVRLWVFPLDLSADYSPNVIPISVGWNSTNVFGVVMALCVLTTALVAWRRPVMSPGVATSRAAAFGVVWFVVAISPISNTLFLSGVLLAERTLYLPSVGLAIATGWFVARLVQERGRVGWVLLAAALALGTVRTWTRTPTWRDNATVFNTMIEEYPQSGRSQWVLGDEFLRVGAVSQALTSYRAAIDILGPHYQLLTEISKQLIGIGRYDAAQVLLEFAWRGDPRFPLAPALISTIRAEVGDAAGTERWAREALALGEYDPIRTHLLAWALAAQGRIAEAREVRDEADRQARVGFWQHWMYFAHVLRAEGDEAGALSALDSAWSVAATPFGRTAVDSVRVAEFGLRPLLEDPLPPPNEGNR